MTIKITGFEHNLVCPWRFYTQKSARDILNTLLNRCAWEKPNYLKFRCEEQSVVLQGSIRLQWLGNKTSSLNARICSKKISVPHCISFSSAECVTHLNVLVCYDVIQEMRLLFLQHFLYSVWR